MGLYFHCLVCMIVLFEAYKMFLYEDGGIGLVLRINQYILN